MRRYTLFGIAALLAGLPAPGQIIQRMERDVAARTKQQQQLENAPLLGSADLREIALFRRFTNDLRSDESGTLRRTALRLSQGDFIGARKDWELALGKMKEREFEPDVDLLVHGVLQQAYLDKDVNVQPLADAVQFREEQRQAVYQERARVERLKAAFDAGKESDDRRIRPLILTEKYVAGVPPVERAEPEAATAESVAKDLQNLVVLCNTADANAQQAVADLQKALDGEVLQTMSNVSKMLHDAAKAANSKA